jgi:putative sterol carrier protein
MKARSGVRFGLTTATMLTAICLAPFSAMSATSSEPDSSTPQEVFDGMRKSFRAEKAKGVHARYQWELSGPNGGEWWIDVNDGTFKMGKGKIDNPSVTFITSDKDWVALSNGTLKGTWAFLTGRLKVRGPQSVAKKLDEIFP